PTHPSGRPFSFLYSVSSLPASFSPFLTGLRTRSAPCWSPLTFILLIYSAAPSQLALRLISNTGTLLHSGAPRIWNFNCRVVIAGREASQSCDGPGCQRLTCFWLSKSSPLQPDSWRLFRVRFSVHLAFGCKSNPKLRLLR
uniref:Uncharacterized protein n=1 Tax=Astyanax mexicanus TaxID=7994 RepID=A0A3B1JVB6_ASTMX